MIIKKLYSEPEIFDPIVFKSGINFITGEKSGEEGNQKTNGVGKTLVLDFIDFCLLSNYKRSRIVKIPNNVMDSDVKIILQFTVGKKEITVKRSRKNYLSPTICIDGLCQDFTDFEDAKKHLAKCIFGNEYDGLVSLREMLSISKRVETVGYESPIKKDNNKYLFTPYLYLFNLDIQLYKRIESTITELITVHNYTRELKKSIEKDGTAFKEVEKQINNLKAQLSVLETSVNTLSQQGIYETISDDIANLDATIEVKTSQLIGIKEEIKQLDQVLQLQEENISHNDIMMVYNECKKSLGNMIIREVKEIEQFKNTINNFKNEIISKRRDDLLKSRDILIKELDVLSSKYQKIVSVLDQQGELRSLKTSIQEYNRKKDEFHKISYLYQQYKEQEDVTDRLKVTRNTTILEEFKKMINDNAQSIESFKNTILGINEMLYGNQEASFSINVKQANKINTKQFVEFVVQTCEDQSGRGKHENALIFDFALLFSNITRVRHLNIILHDGPFGEVNEETKYQILNWLHSQLQQYDFQYILTINRDSFEALESSGKFNFDLNSDVVADYTKDESKRFLRQKFILENK